MSGADWTVKDARRIIKALGERIAWGDGHELTELIELRGAVDDAVTFAVRGQRRNVGATWQSIASGLGVTRSAAYQRYGAATEDHVST